MVTKPKLVLSFCEMCAYPDRNYTTEENLRHLQDQIIDISLLQSLSYLHDKGTALRRFGEVGGLLHITSDMRDDPGLPGHINEYVDLMEAHRDEN